MEKIVRVRIEFEGIEIQTSINKCKHSRNPGPPRHPGYNRVDSDNNRVNCGHNRVDCAPIRVVKKVIHIPAIPHAAFLHSVDPALRNFLKFI